MSEENKRTLQDLQQLQGLPLDLKIQMTKSRIRAWVNEFGVDGVSVSFSGGKDSSVLLHLVREMYPSVKAVHFATGIEYPELERFVDTFTNVDKIRPKMTFVQVVKKYGYPMISKEVSECVYGARRYLKKILTDLQADETVLTDRQTDRQTDAPYRYRFEKICGYGEFEKTNWGGYERKLSNTQSTSTMGRNAETEMHLGDLVRSPESLHLKTALTRDCTRTIDNIRIQRLMNILPMERKTKATMENIPSNRSMYSCERYQFFLDAPFEIGNQCCSVMKKNLSKNYVKKTGRKPITGMMASESRLRTQGWLKTGCNAFDSKNPMSTPMAFWVEQDVLLYIYLHGEEMIAARKKAFEAEHPELTQVELEEIYAKEHLNLLTGETVKGEWGAICSVYGDIIKDKEIDGQIDLADLGLFELDRPTLKTTGADRTGCITCGFGCHHENQSNSRWQNIIDYSNPKLADWILRGGHFNDEGLWEPYHGLGLWFVMEWCNKYGDMKYWYPNSEHYLTTYSTPETDIYLNENQQRSGL